jgi:hypothetical protein
MKVTAIEIDASSKHTDESTATGFSTTASTKATVAAVTTNASSAA